MSDDGSLTSKSAGYSASMIFDLMVEPHCAFTAMRQRPVWLLAACIAATMGVAEALLTQGAVHHATDSYVRSLLQSNTRYSQIGFSEHEISGFVHETIARSDALWWIPVIRVLAAIWVLAGSMCVLYLAPSARTVRFRSFVALAAHVQLVGYGFTGLLTGLIVHFRPAAEFNTRSDILAVIPNLGWLIPQSSPSAIAAFSAISPLSLWASALLVVGVRAITKVDWSLAALYGFAWMGVLIAFMALTSGFSP